MPFPPLEPARLSVASISSFALVNDDERDLAGTRDEGDCPAIAFKLIL